MDFGFTISKIKINNFQLTLKNSWLCIYCYFCTKITTNKNWFPSDEGFVPWWSCNLRLLRLFENCGELSTDVSSYILCTAPVKTYLRCKKVRNKTLNQTVIALFIEVKEEERNNLLKDRGMGSEVWCLASPLSVVPILSFFFNFLWCESDSPNGDVKWDQSWQMARRAMVSWMCPKYLINRQ